MGENIWMWYPTYREGFFSSTVFFLKDISKEKDCQCYESYIQVKVFLCKGCPVGLLIGILHNLKECKKISFSLAESFSKGSLSRTNINKKDAVNGKLISFNSVGKTFLLYTST